MKSATLWLAWIVIGTAAHQVAGAAMPPEEMTQRVDEFEQAGRFREADAFLRDQLGRPTLSPAQRRQLDFERERLRRIRQDYRLARADLFQALQQSVRGLTETEFEQWLAAEWFDGKIIDGTLHFLGASVSNLYFRHPELGARRLRPPNGAAAERAYLHNAQLIRSAAQRQRKPYVLPKRLEVTMTLTVNANAVPPGELIHAWLPVPRQYPFQYEFALLDSSSPVKQLAECTSPIRSAYLEQRAAQGQPTAIRIKYAYTAAGVWFDLDPTQVRRADPADPALRPFLSEAPHVVFTDRIRQLSREIGGEETNPLRKAKRFYEWIAEHIQYSFTPEYSTIRNLGDFCLTHRCGDCGVEALLFMTLCRLNGIPARWQSGWNILPGAESIHDWCEVYLAPYGWVPVDPYMGIYALRYADSLKPVERRALRDFYFGGLSQYRMIANGDHCQTLSPSKVSLRSDNVDFQRGEVEAGGKNLYFDQFSYELAWKEVPASKND